MTDIHVPRIRIKAGPPRVEGWPAPTVFTTIEIDGQMWPIRSYQINGDVKGVPTITLTLEADVTIERPDATP